MPPAGLAPETGWSCVRVAGNLQPCARRMRTNALAPLGCKLSLLQPASLKTVTPCCTCPAARTAPPRKHAPGQARTCTTFPKSGKNLHQPPAKTRRRGGLHTLCCIEPTPCMETNQLHQAAATLATKYGLCQHKAQHNSYCNTPQPHSRNPPKGQSCILAKQQYQNKVGRTVLGSPNTPSTTCSCRKVHLWPG